MKPRLPRRSWRHWTLRARLVLIVAALAAVALVGANAAGLLLLRSYLTDRVDEQLARVITPYARGEVPDIGPGFARRPPGGPGQAIAVFGPDGTAQAKLLYGQDVPPPALGQGPEVLRRAATGKPYTVGAESGGGSWRALARTRPDGGVAVLATSLRDVDDTADRLLLIDAVVTGLILVVLGVSAALAIRVGLRPLTRMAATSAAITEGDLDRRVDDADPHTEPGRLGLALNTMLDRLGAEIAARSASERRLRQFVADASHELRTPLTSIRGFAELYRRGGTPPGRALDETMARIEGEAGRMGLLVEDLLLLARLDLERPPTKQPTDLLAIAADTVRDAYARTPQRPVKLAPLGDAEAYDTVTVLGDEHRLRQVAANLVTNALRHTPPEAAVTVRVGRLPAPSRFAPVPRAAVSAPGADVASLAARGAAVLEVADAGPGIPEAHAGRVFERLYKVDQSRTRSEGSGSGLGLSIVAAIVCGHGGRVELFGAPGHGSTFRVLLPVDGPAVRAALPSAADPAVDSQPAPS